MGRNILCANLSLLLHLSSLFCVLSSLQSLSSVQLFVTPPGVRPSSSSLQGHPGPLLESLRLMGHPPPHHSGSVSGRPLQGRRAWLWVMASSLSICGPHKAPQPGAAPPTRDLHEVGGRRSPHLPRRCRGGP